jgi:DNA repair protein RadC
MVQTKSKRKRTNENIYELEISMRRIRDAPTRVLSSPEDIAKCFADLAKRDREVFCVACLDARSQLIARHTAFVGTTDGVLLNPREVLRAALLTVATGIVVVHNHPSGNPSPSTEDILATDQLAAACKVVGLSLLDHVIIGRDGAFWSWANDERSSSRYAAKSA